MVNSVSLQNALKAEPIYVGSEIQETIPISVMALGTAKDYGVEEDNTRVGFYTGFTETKNAWIVNAKAARINPQVGSSWSLWDRGFSSLTVAFNLSEEDLNKDLGLYLTHLSSDLHQGTYDSAISIYINGHEFKNKYVPASHDWISNDHISGDSMDLRNLVVQGRNTIQIKLRPEARSQYWIHSIMVK